MERDLQLVIWVAKEPFILKRDEIANRQPFYYFILLKASLQPLVQSAIYLHFYVLNASHYERLAFVRGE